MSIYTLIDGTSIRSNISSSLTHGASTSLRQALGITKKRSIDFSSRENNLTFQSLRKVLSNAPHREGFTPSHVEHARGTLTESERAEVRRVGIAPAS